MFLNELAADAERVKEAFVMLVGVMEIAKEEIPGLEPIDFLMAAHNLHVWAITEVERIQEMPPKDKLTLRKMMVDTFRVYLERRE